MGDSEILPELAFRRRELASAFDSQIAVDSAGERVAFSVMCRPEHSVEGDARFLPSGSPAPAIGQRLHIAELATGEVRAIGPEGAASWHASWSPDGGSLAFYCDHDGCPQLWVYDVVVGASRRVCDERVRAKLWVGDEPRWSPDGTELFVPLALSGDDPSAGLESADAAVLVFSSPASADAVEPWEAHFVRENVSDLAAVRVMDGTVRTVVPSTVVPRPSVLQVSPSGRWLCYLSVFHSTDNDPIMRHDLAVASTTGGMVSVLAADVQVAQFDFFLSAYLWHPEQDRLFWIADGQLWTVDLDERVGQPRRLAADIGQVTLTTMKFARDGSAIIAGIDPANMHDYTDPHPRRLAAIPIDGADPVTVDLPDGLVFQQIIGRDCSTAWQPDPDRITVLAREQASARTVILRLNLTTGTAEQLVNQLASIRTAGTTTVDDQQLVGSFEDFTTPADLYLFDADGKRGRRLTTIEPRFEGVGFGSVETFDTRVPQPDGTSTVAATAVLLPRHAKCGDRPPAVMFFYPGGKVSGYAKAFGGGAPSAVPLWPFLAHGYVVLLAEAPIAAMGRDGGNPLDELTAVLLPQLAAASALGYVDPDRIALAGQSYGGYGTAGVISATTVFRAAVAIDGFYDLVGHYGSLDLDRGTDWTSYFETGQGRMGTHPWSNLHRYIANSPYLRADRIHTALLLIHGAADRVCPVGEAAKLFTALKRLNRTVELAVYRGEGHVPLEWSRTNAIDATRRMLAFLDQHVRSQ